MTRVIISFETVSPQGSSGSDITKVSTKKGVGEFSQPRSFLNFKIRERTENVQTVSIYAPSNEPKKKNGTKEQTFIFQKASSQQFTLSKCLTYRERIPSKQFTE